MNVLGISCYYHDAAAVLIREGRVVAAAMEERFSRKKHDNEFPTRAIAYCLDWANIRPEDVDVVAFYEKPITKFERVLFQHLEHFPRSRKTFVDTITSWFDYKMQIPKMLKKHVGYTGRVVYIPHHLSHAASAFYPSGFPNSAIVTIDGVGEWATTTIGIGKKQGITIEKEIQFPHSLGLFYSTITAYLGFDVNDAEYKVMGLAAYGNPEPFLQKMRQLVQSFDDGSYALNMEYFDYSWADHMASEKMAQLFGHPPRKKESPMQQQYADIAASGQQVLEETVFHLLKAVHKRYKTNRLCLAGGVALNSVMNGKIITHTPFTELYIPPDPGDGGGAMGAAFVAHHRQQRPEPLTPWYPSLGPRYSREQIIDEIAVHHLPYKEFPDEKKLLDWVASMLIRQKIIGWFHGRMEWGPRALGNRSILASAATNKMKDIINSKVKHRELFRPFAPVILAPYTDSYFFTDPLISQSAAYMLLVYPFRPKGKKEVPATVHVDGSGRLQILHRHDNPRYYDLIDTYRRKTKTPIIINTSFNVRGEPIVCTPKDAIACFLHTDIDILVLENIVITKKGLPL